MGFAPVSIAAVQMCATDDLARNLATCRALAARAADAGAQIIVLPECFAFLGRREGDKMAIAETIDDAHPGPIVETLQAIATQHRAVVVGGGLPERVPGDDRRAYNTALVVGPGGELAARYRKIHLFDVDLPARDDQPATTLRESDAGAAPVDAGPDAR